MVRALPKGVRTKERKTFPKMVTVKGSSCKGVTSTLPDRNCFPSCYFQDNFKAVPLFSVFCTEQQGGLVYIACCALTPEGNTNNSRRNARKLVQRQETQCLSLLKLRNKVSYTGVECLEVWSIAMDCNAKYWPPRTGCPQEGGN